MKFTMSLIPSCQVLWLKAILHSVDGRMLIEDVNDMFNLDIEDDDVDSIGGWLFTRLEGNPVKGKKIEQDGYIFEVAESERIRVLRVNIYKNKVQEPNEPKPEL